MAVQSSYEDEFSLDDERLVGELVVFSPTVFNRRRLAILYELFSTPAIDFNQLKHDTRLRDGILGTHLRTLVRTRMAEVKKEEGSRSKTRYAITEKGRRKLLELLELLGKVNNRMMTRDLR